MSNTHKIVNKQTGLEIEGTLMDYHGPDYFGLRIEGSRYTNSFDHEDWDIIELPKPLPTEPGLYAEADADLASGLFELYHLDQDGHWGTERVGRWVGIDANKVPRNLVRLVKEQA